MQVGGCAVVEVGGTCRQSAQNQPFTAIEVAAQSRDQRLAGIAGVKRCGLGGIERIRAPSDEKDGKIGQGELRKSRRDVGSVSARGSTECPVPISRGSGKEWFPTFGALWHVVQVPVNELGLPSVALSFNPRTLEICTGALSKRAAPAAIFRRWASLYAPKSSSLPFTVDHALNSVMDSGPKAAPVGSAPNESLIPG